MEVGYAEYRLPRDLAGFEPVKTAPKMPRELGGRGGKNNCIGLRPAPPLAKARVTPASYR